MVYQIDPLKDPRWNELLHGCSRASVFHTSAWLESLHRTYGYEPVAYTTSLPGRELRNAIVFCRVASWLTGRRLVSLPFSDHCEPLIDDPAELQFFSPALKEEFHRDRLAYVEIRPKHELHDPCFLFHSNRSFCFHQLELTPDLDTIFKAFHKNSTQRKVRRAEREGLTYSEGQSESLLDHFYHLLLFTRRRHQVPPQPKLWFRNLIACFGEALKIRVALKGTEPVAAILTLQHKDTLVYKYGCSNALWSALGGTHLLFWQAIQQAKRDGLRLFDLGRSDCDNQGLITFKDRWGATRSTLTYSRFTASAASKANFASVANGWNSRMARQVFSHLPDGIFRSAGSLIYKHLG